MRFRNRNELLEFVKANPIPCTQGAPIFWRAYISCNCGHIDFETEDDVPIESLFCPCGQAQIIEYTGG